VGTINSLIRFTFNYKKNVLTNKKKNLSLFPTFSTCVLFLGIFSLITILITSLPTSYATNDSPQSSMSPELEHVAKVLLNKIAINSTSNVVIFGPMEPSTKIVEDSLGDRTPSELIIPQKEGNYFVFFVNDVPEAMYEHPVRLAWLNLDDESYDVVNASWPPLIIEPNVPPEPTKLIGSSLINDVLFTSASGSGKGTPQDTSKKADAFSQIKQINCKPGVITKTALVMDLGDKKWTLPQSLADNLSDEADMMAAYLEDNGYSVIRVSQYWGNSHPSLQTTFTVPDALETVFILFLDEIRMNLICPPANSSSENPSPVCCHEFFLFIAAHGTSDGQIVIFKDDGSGQKDGIELSDLAATLQLFPPCVKLITFLDSCYSGNLLKGESLRAIKSRCNLSPCGVTVITSTDDSSWSWMPGLGLCYRLICNSNVNRIYFSKSKVVSH